MFVTNSKINVVQKETTLPPFTYLQELTIIYTAVPLIMKVTENGIKFIALNTVKTYYNLTAICSKNKIMG